MKNDTKGCIRPNQAMLAERAAREAALAVGADDKVSKGERLPEPVRM
ncbi:MAG: hypothetical protein AAFV62_02495 [Pseudomonadota bacterium]